MRKWTAWVLIMGILLCAQGAWAEAADFSSLSNEELILWMNKARTELFLRSDTEDEPQILFERDGYSIRIDGGEFKEGKLYLYVTIINDSQETWILYQSYGFVNGWNVDCYDFDGRNYLEPGQRVKKDGVVLRELEEKADVTLPEQIDEVELQFHIDTKSGQKEFVTAYLTYSEEAGFRIVSLRPSW